MNTDSNKQLEEFAADTIRQRLVTKPSVGLVLGSGLNALSDSVAIEASIPYADIQGWPLSAVPGHENKLVAGTLAGCSVVMMCGRVHYYEGFDLAQVTYPIRVMRRLGVKTLIVTNAAGGVNPEYEPGDVMLIRDHLNFIGLAGQNPLRGPNDDSLGVRFPDMSQAYDRDLQRKAVVAAQKAGVLLKAGVYAGVAGPSFETPAEVRFLRLAGADAVGMSTVPEVISARHAGMRVLGLSGISNQADMDGATITTHAEVLAAGSRLAPKMAAIVRGVLESGEQA